MDLFELVIKKRESYLPTASLILTPYFTEKAFRWNRFLSSVSETHWNEHLEDQITVFIELFPAIRINLRNWGKEMCLVRGNLNYICVAIEFSRDWKSTNRLSKSWMNCTNVYTL